MTDGRDRHFDRVPRWDGNPATRQRFRDEVRLWTLSEDLNVNYSLAARLVKNMTGPARRACLTLTDEQLLPGAPVEEVHNADDVITTPGRPADLRAGIDNVLRALDASLGDEAAVRKGTSMTDFFETHKYHRAPGERMAEWITRWDEAVARLQEDGVDIVTGIPDLAGWFLLRMSNLSAFRRETVVGTFRDDSYQVPVIKRALLRL